MPTPRKSAGTEPAPPIEPSAPPVDADVEPEWAAALRGTIESLPGRLQAIITEDDRRSIAESVHGLFEQSGAFTAPPAATEDGGGETETEVVEVKEDPPGGRAAQDPLAVRLFGAPKLGG